MSKKAGADLVRTITSMLSEILDVNNVNYVFPTSKQRRQGEGN